MSTPPAAVEVRAKDLLGEGTVVCPQPGTPAWSQHPRVFIDLSASGEGKCPYCGTQFRLKAGESVSAH